MEESSFEERAATAMSDANSSIADLDALAEEGVRLRRELDEAIRQNEVRRMTYPSDEADRESAHLLSRRQRRHSFLLQNIIYHLDQTVEHRRVSKDGSHMPPDYEWIVPDSYLLW